MESLSACSIAGRFPLRFLSTPTKPRSLSCRRSRHFPILASRDGPELDKYDQMELKFGRLLGEDPNLTLAKVMARKSDPNASYLEVEKSFYKKKGDLSYSTIDVREDANLRRPAMNKGELNYSKIDDREDANLRRPVMHKGVQISRPVEKAASIERQSDQLQRSVDSKSEIPNVTLRKPSIGQGDDTETDKYAKMKIKPNLFLKMRRDSGEKISDVTLLKKPEVINMPLDQDQDKMRAMGDDLKILNPSDLLRSKPEMDNSIEVSDAGIDADQGPSESNIDSIPELSKPDDALDVGLQPPKQSGVETSTSASQEKSVTFSSDTSRQAALQGKPQRVDSSMKEVLRPTEKETAILSDEVHSSASDVGDSISADQEEHEDNDWRTVEHLLRSGERTEVELVSCSSRGFVVSFGSLIGFLPYRNVGAKWKFLAFESWLRKKGLDPSLYRQNLSILGSYDIQNKDPVTESSKNQEMDQEDEEILLPTMKFEDLLEAYDKEKTNFLTSFIGQRIRVTIILADRKSRRLMFSGRPKEREELVEKKRSLMTRLSIGEIVKCCIKKVTYFGIFVEVEGVPALIHQSEVSWDATLDPSSFYKIGQTVEAKVHQLDYALERITLSLKEVTPDPLKEALESVVGDHAFLDGSFEAAQADIEEWADVESLAKELQQIDGVQSVSKGRFFLSPGLAPTFQVYMASVFDDQYKLLARYGNKVQEILVQASLDKEQMKAAILTCTNRVQ